MMNAKELRQAAAYIVEQWDNHDKFRMVEGDEAFMNADGEPDAVSMARHILATVRDDDDEPVGREYVNKNFTPTPRKVVDNCCQWWWITDSVFLAVSEYEVWTICTNDTDPTCWHVVSEVKTRGQFRSLCKGLGIELEEKSNAD